MLPLDSRADRVSGAALRSRRYEAVSDEGEDERETARDGPGLGLGELDGWRRPDRGREPGLERGTGACCGIRDVD